MTRNKPTRFYSNRQERAVAKAVKGKQTPNSGATPFQKGDVVTKAFLIEAKTAVIKSTERKTFTIKKEWFEKNKEEAFAMGKPYSAIVFDFGDGEQHYIINEKLFKMLMDYIQEGN